MRRSLLLATVAAVILTLVPAPAEARMSQTLGYRYEQVWRTTVRLIRVDLGYEIIEQDRDNGYVLFEYRFGGSRFPASVELINEDPEGARVRLQVRVERMPQVERVVMNRLQRKLRDEFGRAQQTGEPHTWWDRDDRRRDREREARQEARERSESESESDPGGASDD